jgi:hypothetical protein
MFFRAIVFCLAFMGLSWLARAAELPGCPDIAWGETAEDCPWAGAARALAAGETWDRALPEFRERLEADARLEGLKAAWGRSLNYDELARGVIVEPAILDALGAMLGVAGREDRVVHAGMEHTYGYLFSVLRTPFGFKRARWVRGELEAGFGLPAGTLGPAPAEGSLFANVTYFAGRVAFRGELTLPAESVAAATVLYPYEELAVARLEEAVSSPRPVRLRTDLVAFPHPPAAADANSHLLVYSVHDGGPKLITAFPVNRAFVARVLDPSGLGADKPVATRYNAYVEGLTGNASIGERRIAETPWRR